MIRLDGTLYIPPDISGRNPITGRFVKGLTPANKGRKWDEWVSKAGQRKMRKGWKNLDIYRSRGVANAAEVFGVAVVAVRNNGQFHIFELVKQAGEWVGGDPANVSRCCRFNRERHINRKTGKINTNHQYKGVRFYYATDLVWQEKIGKEIEL